MALLLPACASRGPTPLARVEPSRCEAGPNLASAALLKLDQAQPESLRFDDRTAACVSGEDAVPARYIVVRLPRYRRPWTLSLDSGLSGQNLFAPEAYTLDEQGRTLRSLSFDRFTQRGDQLSATLFFDAENAGEQYLLLRAATQAVGRTGQQLVSGLLAVPFVAGLLPMVYVQGTERERSYTLSDQGVVQLQARTTSRTRRMSQAQDLARTELGAMAH